MIIIKKEEGFDKLKNKLADIFFRKKVVLVSISNSASCIKLVLFLHLSFSSHFLLACFLCMLCLFQWRNAVGITLRL